MDLCLKNRLLAGATVVSNTFIDEYMAGASGEYVKVYLYFLRHAEETVTVEAVAEALNHTEADVRRALAYWQRAGVLSAGESSAEKPVAGVTSKERTERKETAFGRTGSTPNAAYAGRQAVYSDLNQGTNGEEAAALRETGACCDMEQLSRDENFSQLIYIAQKYLNKTFTPTDCQILANLYANLKMAPELLEYLMEYCAQNNHSSLRYIEKVALNWHERKILTVEQAKAYSRSFSKESFSVMKAMGLTGRNPADLEYELMEKWFRSYGFTKEIVVEACNRTIRAIHNPSFQYADRILTDWKLAKVRTLADIEALDKLRKEQEKKKEKSGGRTAAGGSEQKNNRSRTSNRFHNLEEHGYDYDEMVWSMINSGQDAGGGDGTQ